MLHKESAKKLSKKILGEEVMLPLNTSISPTQQHKTLLVIGDTDHA